jgi:hypothetical protein
MMMSQRGCLISKEKEEEKKNAMGVARFASSSTNK